MFMRVVNIVRFSINSICFDRKRERENKRTEMHLFLWRLEVLKKQRIRVTEYYILLDGTSANKKERFHPLSLSLCARNRSKLR